ncbi:hypothetical protein DFA_06519 [Cavenderia fasciculata]|uniref:TPR repeat-containing protein n=1 Tax=Cavenderia fasciculata TaxID=261658 RepID=F4PJ83_CACFS|nr:uncharacterized protein DFA_06519 [Cavenderia fasciculata]EGG24369.1 hypothetical protein DFA_06519 [Cavenderia fasciculata]|eukprot:XP_004362220.1 hypothetical protein DFA_06519 [Cavenderia fasciculata]
MGQESNSLFMEVEFNNARDYELARQRERQQEQEKNVRKRRHRNQLHHIFVVLKIKLKRFFTCKCFRSQDASSSSSSGGDGTIESTPSPSDASKRRRRNRKRSSSSSSKKSHDTNTNDTVLDHVGDIPSSNQLLQQQLHNNGSTSDTSTVLTDQNSLPDTLENLNGSKRGCDVAVPGGDHYHFGSGGARTHTHPTVITIPSVQKNDIDYQTQRADTQPYLDQLSKMQSLYQTELQSSDNGKVSKQTSYQLARTLSHSEQVLCKRKSIDLYKDLLKEEKDNRDIIMELASTYYKIEDYQNALKYAYKILDTHPLDNQAITLKYMSQNAIKEQLRKKQQYQQKQHLSLSIPSNDQNTTLTAATVGPTNVNGGSSRKNRKKQKAKEKREREREKDGKVGSGSSRLPSGDKPPLPTISSTNTFSDTVAGNPNIVSPTTLTQTTTDDEDDEVDEDDDDLTRTDDPPLHANNNQIGQYTTNNTKTVNRASSILNAPNRTDTNDSTTSSFSSDDDVDDNNNNTK